MTLIGNTSRHRRRPWLRWVLGSCVLLTLLAALTARVVLGEIVRYQGEQMEPALKSGDWLVIDFRSEPETGDVVLVDAEPRPVVRRLAAISGDAIPARVKETAGSSEAPSASLVPTRQVYLSCDRAQWCTASDAIGLTNAERIIGIVSSRWTPPF